MEFCKLVILFILSWACKCQGNIYPEDSLGINQVSGGFVDNTVGVGANNVVAGGMQPKGELYSTRLLVDYCHSWAKNKTLLTSGRG